MLQLLKTINSFEINVVFKCGKKYRILIEAILNSPSFSCQGVNQRFRGETVFYGVGRSGMGSGRRQHRWALLQCPHVHTHRSSKFRVVVSKTKKSLGPSLLQNIQQER